jgi:predicted amidohydrolase
VQGVSLNPRDDNRVVRLDRIRVASLQYFIRPVATFEQFQEQVTALVETAADYGAHLLVFPEYFSVQLLTLGDVKRPIRQQIRDLASQVDRLIDLFSDLARDHEMYIVGGTFPELGPDRHTVFNHCYVFGPTGNHGVQAKLHMTRFETEEWDVSAGTKLRIFQTSFGKIAVAICYDVEFPEIARAAAREDVHVLVAPSCTDDRQGFLRVRYCAQARAIENQIYVITSHTVGSLPMVPAVHLNYGQAAILTPSDFPFARDGLLAEGNINHEMMVIAELNMEIITHSRTTGTVLPLEDSRRTARLVSEPETVTL